MQNILFNAKVIKNLRPISKGATKVYSIVDLSSTKFLRGQIVILWISNGS